MAIRRSARVPNWYGSVWQEMIEERDNARRAAKQGRENVAAGRCVNAYHSMTAATMMSMKSVGMARVLDAARLLSPNDRAAFEDIDTEVHETLMDAETKCGWISG